MWHEGLFVKLYIRESLYACLAPSLELVQTSSCSVTWRPHHAPHSPSGLGVTIDTIYCGGPMYADDLALVVDSLEELQAMLNIVHTYAGKWRYNLNAGKSFCDCLRRIPPLKNPCKILSGMVSRERRSGRSR